MASTSSSSEREDQTASGESGGSSSSSASNKTAKKSAATKATAKRTSTKKTATKRSSPPRRNSSSEESSGRSSNDKKPGATQVAQSAVKQLVTLTGRTPECVVGVEPNDDGWLVSVEVVESRRIPDSTDVMATYQVQCDDDGDLLRYHRSSRYIRGKGDGRG